MIYPDVDMNTWLKKYPELRIARTSCNACGLVMVSNKPYISKDYVGLVSAPCACGKSKKACMSSLPTSESEIAAWDEVLHE